MKLFKSSRLIAVNNILFQTVFSCRKGSYRVWQSLEICPAISRSWKSLKNSEEVGKKIVKNIFDSNNKCCFGKSLEKI